MARRRRERTKATRLDFEIEPQPDDTTCGPTCLHAVYRYFGDRLALSRVVEEVARLEEGGTLGALLGLHALGRGYRATLYTYNLRVFDPSWFGPDAPDMRERLRAQREAKAHRKLRAAIDAYLGFLDAGGRILFEDLSPGLIRRHLKRGVPILTGLSSTYLHRSTREYGPEMVEDDVRGLPAGHFVVIHGYDRKTREAHVADPLLPNPLASGNLYPVGLSRLVCAILLGILTYDGNLLVVEP